MRSFRFSLRWLFAVVSFAAIGCGLLVYATPLTANLIFSFSLLLLTCTALAAVFSSGQRRSFCTGFAVLGLAYFWLVCGSWQIANIRARERLMTTLVLEWCH